MQTAGSTISNNSRLIGEWTGFCSADTNDTTEDENKFITQNQVDALLNEVLKEYIKNEILEESQNKQDKLIQKLQSNMIQESTEQDTSIHVEDASDLASVLNIEGNHYQEISESSPAEIFTVKDNIKLIQCNKNIFKLPDSTLVGVELVNQENGSYKLNGASTASWAYREGEAIWLFPGKYTISIETSENVAAYFGIRTDDNSLKVELTTARKEYTFEITKTTKVKPYFTCSSSAVFNNNIVKVQLEKASSKTSWVKHEKNEYNLAVQQEMLAGDYFDLENGKEVHNWTKIASYNGENITTDYISSTGELSTGATVYYKSNIVTELELTEEQKATLQQLNNLELFKGVNNIYTEQNLALLQLDYTADTKMYIDNKIAAKTAESEV